MREEIVTGYRARIVALLAELAQEDALGAAGQAIVELDQQAVGRLSRMDALQNQAMAKAQSARRAGEERRLKAALARIDEGEFGFCTDCGEALEPARLAADPAIPRCLSCVRG